MNHLERELTRLMAEEGTERFLHALSVVAQGAAARFDQYRMPATSAAWDTFSQAVAEFREAMTDAAEKD